MLVMTLSAAGGPTPACRPLGLTLLSVPAGPRRPGQGIEDEEQGIVGGVQTETG